MAFILLVCQAGANRQRKKFSWKKRNISATLDFLCNFRMVTVAAELLKCSRKVVFKDPLLFQMTTTQQQLIPHLLICLLFEHLPKGTFLAQILGEWLFFVPMPLFSCKQKYLRSGEKWMFLIVCQLLFFIHYCCYCYCYGVRRFWIGYDHCMCDLGQSLWPAELGDTLHQDLYGITQPWGKKDLLWRSPEWELTCFYRFQHQTREETQYHLAGRLLSTGRQAFTSNHRYKG